MTRKPAQRAMRTLPTASLKEWKRAKPAPWMAKRALDALLRAVPEQWRQPIELSGLGKLDLFNPDPAPLWLQSWDAMQAIAEFDQRFGRASSWHLSDGEICAMAKRLVEEAQELDKPAGTVTTVDHHSFVTANLTKFRVGSTGTALDKPVHTVTAGGTPKRLSTGNTMGLITSHMVKLRGQNVGAATHDPVKTISAQGTHHGEVRAFLVKYYGSDKDGQELADPLHTIPTRDRFGLVMIKGEPYAIVDIGLRMLSPRELYRAQGFPETYVIDTGAAGEPITKTAQVRMCGNSVCPPLSHALVKANYCERQALRKAA